MMRRNFLSGLTRLIGTSTSLLLRSRVLSFGMSASVPMSGIVPLGAMPGSVCRIFTPGISFVVAITTSISSALSAVVLFTGGALSNDATDLAGRDALYRNVHGLLAKLQGLILRESRGVHHAGQVIFLALPRRISMCSVCHCRVLSIALLFTIYGRDTRCGYARRYSGLSTPGIR